MHLLFDRLNKLTAHSLTSKATSPATRWAVRAVIAPLLLLATCAAHAGSITGSSTYQTNPGTIDLTTEGTADWIHWGLSNATSLNRKLGGGSSISDLSPASGTTLLRFGGNPANWSTHSWTDGSPTGTEAGFPGGLFSNGSGGSYSFTLPADTTERTAIVYLGSSNSISDVQATLSDNSAPPFNVTLPEVGTGDHYVVVLTYTADGPNQTLTVSQTHTGGTAAIIGIQAVTLSESSSNSPPTLNPVGDQTVQADNTLSFTATATDPSGPAPIVMTISQAVPALPTSATYNDNGDGTADFSWTPTSADIGDYNVTLRAAESGTGALFSEETIVISVTSSATGSITGSAVYQSTPATIDYSAQGSADWIHWGLTNAGSVNRKSSGGSQLTNLVTLGGASLARFGGNPANWSPSSWTDGSPVASQNGFPGGLFTNTSGGGYEFTAPAGGGSRTLFVYLGASSSESRVTATLSDASAPPLVIDLPQTSSADHYIVTINYDSPTAGNTLTVTHTHTGGNTSIIGIQGATLQSSANAAPVIDAIGDQTTVANVSLDFPVTATDTDGPAPLVLAVQSSVPTLPAAATFTDNSDGTGDFSWTPGTTDIGDYLVTFRATDDAGNGDFSEQTITVSVTATNSAPTIDAIGNQTVTTPNNLAFAVTADDPDGPAPLVLTLESSTPALPPAATFTDNTDGTADFSWTPGVADAGDYLVTFRATDDAGNGLFSEETITISVVAASNTAPNIDPIGNQAITVPNTLSFEVTATDTDGPAPLVLALESSVPALPTSATFIDNTDGTGDFSWTPLPADVGTYQVTFEATDDDGNGLSSQQTIEIVVNAAGTGSLTGTSVLQTSPGTVNYTAAGQTDWIHWGRINANSVNRKSSGGSQLSDLTVTGASLNRFGGNPANWTTTTWNDGTPRLNENGFPGGVYLNASGASYEFTAPADGSPRLLTVYLGASNAESLVEATLSDGSAAPYSVVLPAQSNADHYVITLNYEAASPGATLLIKHTHTGGATNIIGIQGATLSAPVSLPFSDDFSDNNFDGWGTFDDTPDSSLWSVVSGELIQANRVQSVFAQVDAFQLGTTAFLLNASSLADYEFSVTAEFQATGFQESIGVVFRYQDPLNYYRLSISGRNGFARLEKQVNGVFTPLATNARGYTTGETLDIEITAEGSSLVAEINGDEVFAVVDSDLATGSIGLFSQDTSRFDNVNLVELDSLPDVTLRTPLAYSTESGNAISASAAVRNAPPGAEVEFVLDGSITQTDSSEPYTALFTGLAQGNYTVEAILVDNTGELDRDTNDTVGRGGNLTVAIGDSITDGVGDSFASDNVSSLQRVISTQGYTSVLTDLLNSTSTLDLDLVVNEGIGGDQTFDAAFSRVEGVRQRHAEMDRAFILLGTNDALASIPDGDGCTTNCAGTFKGNLQTLVDKLRFDDYPSNTQLSGISVVVAEIPPAFTSSQPFTSTTNNLVRDYNTIINNQITGVTVGPDLFDFFMPSASDVKDSLFADTLHPNGLGYQIVATLWHNSVSLPSEELPIPFYVEDLSTTGSAAPKQDLIEVGDEIYLDSSTTVTAFPAVLNDGRWLQTNDSDSSNTLANYLSFDVDRDVEVYVAFESGSTNQPAWLSGFTATGQTVTTDSSTAPTYDLYVQTFSAGTVVLGGSSASPAANVDANMLVIVVEI